MIIILYHQFQSVAPFFVATSMSGISRTSLSVPGAVGFARAAVATIGIKKFTRGYLPHEIQVSVTVYRAKNTID